MSSVKYFSLFCLILIFNNQVQSDDVKPDINPEQLRNEALEEHNRRREQCNAAPLQRNTTLDAIAQSWCDDLVKNNHFNHSGTVEYGENSYEKVPFDFVNDNGATPAKAWCNENIVNGSTKPEDRLHFSQCVWKSTKMFGLGICRRGNNGLIFVARYYPRGNYKDLFAQNVGC